MTLNASGPLSFGGATTGQSINLELGVSATALASINSTSFRTLAGVASGQISVSSFYGKSNAYGWVTYLGSSSSGSTNATGQGFFIDNLSNFYWIYKSGATSNAVGRLSSDGVLSTFALPFANTNISMGNLSNTRLSTAGVALRNVGTGAQMLLGSTLNSLYPNTVGISMNVQDQAITSSSQIVSSGMRNVGKFGGQPSIAFYNAAGTTATTYQFPVADVGTRVVIKTDGTIVLIDKGPSMIFRTFTSSFTPNNDYYNLPVTGLGNSTNLKTCISSSNEIFACAQSDTSNRSVVRINSSYVITNRVEFPSSGFGQGFVQIATSSGYVYVMVGNFTEARLTCLLASDLSTVFTNVFTFNGSSLLTDRLSATANGVFISIVSISDNKYIAFKMPLTGMPSASSVVVSGASATLAWTRPTVSPTAQSVSTLPGSTQTPTSVASTTVVAPSAGSPVTPIATNTIIS